VTELNFSMTPPDNATGASGINFTGPIWYPNAARYQQFKLGGAS